jgi:hypothetical protein
VAPTFVTKSLDKSRQKVFDFEIPLSALATLATQGLLRVSAVFWSMRLPFPALAERATLANL